MAFLIRSDLRYPCLISDLTFLALSLLSCSLVFVGSFGGGTIHPCIFSNLLSVVREEFDDVVV